MENFLTYFCGTALYHAQRKERLDALRAVWRAFAVFPTRTLRMLLSDSSLRDAFLLAVRGVKADSVSTQ
jgi:hypothetical protein